MAKEIGRKLGMEEFSEVTRLYAEASSINGAIRGFAVNAGYDEFVPLLDRLSSHLSELAAVLRVDAGELSAEYERIKRRHGVTSNLSS